MLAKLLKSRRSAPPPAARVPDGTRVYAIGDIHGRLDLLNQLLELIDSDDAGRGAAETTLVFLGDLIDRGPHSAQVVERLRLLADGPTQRRLRFLLGNHEEVFLAAVAGDRRALRGFCRIGGRETVLSYGVEPTEYERLDYDELFVRLVEQVPAAHLAFLERFEDLLTIGDYLFVHAGVDPSAPLDRQLIRDLRWIREPFLDHDRPLDKMVVHGHTIAAEVERRPHRIGIDTGAYESGRLTALGLESDRSWTLTTG